MKVKQLKRIALVLIAVCFTATVKSETGSVGGGGGNLGALSKMELKNIIINLKPLVRDSIGKIDSELLSKESRTIFLRMMSLGLIQDVMDSPYIPEEECRDLDGNATETDFWTPFSKGAPICYGLNRLVKKDELTLEVLIGQTLHEHAHHFEYKDTKVETENPLNQMAKEIAEQLTNKKNTAKPEPLPKCSDNLNFVKFGEIAKTFNDAECKANFGPNERGFLLDLLADFRVATVEAIDKRDGNVPIGYTCAITYLESETNTGKRYLKLAAENLLKLAQARGYCK